jgi:hypothetical protein
VGDDQNSLTAGERGPVLMQNAHLLDKLSHFDRERIPERVVMPKAQVLAGTLKWLRMWQNTPEQSSFLKSVSVLKFLSAFPQSAEKEVRMMRLVTHMDLPLSSTLKMEIMTWQVITHLCFSFATLWSSLTYPHTEA